MFETLSNKLSKLRDSLQSSTRLSEKNIAQILEEIEHNLLDADVSMTVIKSLIEKTKQECLGQKITDSLTPGQSFIKIFHQELIHILSAEDSELNLKIQPPVIILLAGLQGAGKTTTAAKLAFYIKKHLRKRVLLASADVYRPAALEQLHILSDAMGCDYFKYEGKNALEASKKGLISAQKGLYDVFILDTAGRNTLDDKMMNEINQIQEILKPKETFFVADSMLGQKAAEITEAFNQKIKITGIILTKVDGDTRGGAALSIAHITKKPIKFVGLGEGVEKLEPFRAKETASLILGLGDILSLVEKISQESTHQKTKISHQFTFNDFKQELLKINQSGGISAMIKYLPKHMQKDQRFNQLPNFNQYIYAIDSMTKKERLDPSMLKASHKRRISQGSGVNIQTINQMLLQFKQISKIQKKSKNKKNLFKALGMR